IEREPVLAARPDVEPKQCRNLDRARFEVESVGLHIAFEIDEFTGEAEQAALVAAEPEAGAPPGLAVEEVVGAIGSDGTARNEPEHANTRTGVGRTLRVGGPGCRQRQEEDQCSDASA